MSASSVVELGLDALRPSPNNARVHSKKQLRQIADSIKRFGFTNPVLISDNNEIVAGHGRVAAAKLLGLQQVPTIRLSHLSAAERRAYVLADNKLALNAGWDHELLASELGALAELDIDLSAIGFDVAEADAIISEAEARKPTPKPSRDDTVPPQEPVAITRTGDLWRLGRHRLLCGDARVAADYATLLLPDERVDLVFTDPPYNVAIDGHVCGLGRQRHREFAMASGEMDAATFTCFLTEALSATAAVMRDGAIAFVCMDWRHIGELLAAGTAAFNELKNLVIWNKTNGGMGTFYRSKHELIFVFKKGEASHTNTFGLGDGGRYRTNVWDYAGISSPTASRSDELAMHPTVKPVALVVDALKDCSRRGEVVLDVFGGSGTTLIAAERSGRQCRMIEYDPAYCDTIIRRWQNLTGKLATLGDGATFEDVTASRVGELS